MLRNNSSKRVDASANSHMNAHFSKKDRPFCTHCNYHGHTIEKCYKIHGYPPGYKHKSKPQSTAVNQVTTQIDQADTSDHSPTPAGHFL